MPVLTELEAVPLSPRAELTIYRLIQEAFTNIAKYANASEIQVRLLNRDGRALVEVRDNGQGFDTKQQTLSSHGLLGMRYRVAAEGGQLMISSVRGQGTVLSASLPLPAPPPAAPL